MYVCNYTKCAHYRLYMYKIGTINYDNQQSNFKYCKKVFEPIAFQYSTTESIAFMRFKVDYCMYCMLMIHF